MPPKGPPVEKGLMCTVAVRRHGATFGERGRSITSDMCYAWIVLLHRP